MGDGSNLRYRCFSDSGIIDRSLDRTMTPLQHGKTKLLSVEELSDVAIKWMLANGNNLTLEEGGEGLINHLSASGHLLTQDLIERIEGLKHDDRLADQFNKGVDAVLRLMSGERHE